MRRKFGTMTTRRIETIVGLFVLAGLAGLAYIAVSLGDFSFGTQSFQVYAEFDSVAGLKRGASVEVAGVDVGRVERIYLKEDRAILTLSLHKSVKLQEDAIASIRTKGLIGNKYVRISLGGSSRYIAPGGRIMETESPIEIEELIRRFALGKIG